ncbi:MAG TPA: IucA/IucC family protein [Pseudonocardiaceae bacterium]|nr:IucA/IucC family protein [Pseudonocardiaceae bacterium]
MTLLRAVLDTLLREDFCGMRTRGSVVDGWLRFRDCAIPVRPDGFLCDIAVAEPMVEYDGRQVTDLDSVLALFRCWVEPDDVGGFDAFVTECRDARATMALQQAHRVTVPHRPGMAGSLRYDTLAAHVGHPVYPTGLARQGIAPADQLRYAPEYHPTFGLRWMGIPAAAVTSAGTLPDWWPTPDDLGLTGDVVPFPVHPLAGAGPEWLTVAPTLSMRTVAVLADPDTHIKLPLPTSTLGLRNRRTIKPGTLVDGAVIGRLLAAVLAREPRFADRILLADEQTYSHANDELRTFLIRRYPTGLDPADVVTLAALPACSVPDDLADRYFAGDRTALLTEYLTLLLDFQVTLLLRYGIALESHQQNISLVLDRVTGRTRTRLLLKDNDGPRVRADRLPPDLTDDLALLDDQRVLVAHTEPLIDVFTTITLHLCAAAIVFGTGGIDRRLVRDLLVAAIDRHPDSADRRLLVANTLAADRLPVKAMVTAGTLLTKQRSGAADINKFYLRSGPNYLTNRST